MVDASKKVGIIVQARMGSSRLPGKVFKKVLGKPLLEYQLERLKRSAFAKQIIVATTLETRDDPIVDLCARKEVSVYRGSEEDVLSRYFEAASKYQLDLIVRITADCPLIDPQVIDRGISVFLQNLPTVDYVSNCHPRTFPRGMDTEIFSFETLRKTHQLAKKPKEKEHVTLYMYEDEGRFQIINFEYPRDCSSIQLSVDTMEDFALIQKIFEALYSKNPYFVLEDILSFLASN